MTTDQPSKTRYLYNNNIKYQFKIILLCLVNHLIYKLSKNSEKHPLQFHWDQGDDSKLLVEEVSQNECVAFFPSHRLSADKYWALLFYPSQFCRYVTGCPLCQRF